MNLQTKELYEENLKLKEKIESMSKANILHKIFHMIPFLHFYTPWSDTKDCREYGGYERQTRFCKVCNKKQYRIVSNAGESIL